MPMLNRPLLEHLLLHLHAHGVGPVTLAMTRTPESDAIRAAFGDGASLGIEIDYAYEDTALGSGGAVAGAAMGWDEPFFVCNGDIMTGVDLTAMVDAHHARGAELSMFLRPVEDPSPFGVAVLDADRRIVHFVEKPPRESAPSNLINAGIWLFEPSLIDELDPARHSMLERELFPALADAGRAIVGFEQDCYWTDVGTPGTYLQVNMELLAGALPARLPAGWPEAGVLIQGDVDAGATVQAPALVGPETRVESRARIEGGVTVGARCVVGAGSTVSGSVIWDGVTIGENATVRDSILASGVSVGAGAVVEGAVIAHESSIPAGARLQSGGARSESSGSPATV